MVRVKLDLLTLVNQDNSILGSYNILTLTQEKYVIETKLLQSP